MESQKTREHRVAVLLGGILLLIGAMFAAYTLYAGWHHPLSWPLAILCSLSSFICFWAWRFGSAYTVKEISRGL